MKFHTERTEIERSGVNTETEFKIKTTAKAFDILSSGLYSDNILAIVRELSCNAYDSHVSVDRKDVPFEIHLPNQLEPFFAVKDFGSGLSDEDVMSLYTTYFESTKTNSNDYIGALGLGSKSPFSYTKAFEVISQFENMRRVYSVFINEDGVPTIARIGDAIPTDEHNGLTIKMTVDDDDFYKFSSASSRALRWFPTKPNVHGDPYFEFLSPPDTDMQGDGWYAYKQGGYRYGSMQAVQGNVEYRVDIDQIEEIAPSIKTFLQQVNVIAFFDIGDLEVAASREEIRYDARTKAALAKRINSIHESALKTVEDKVDEYSSSNWDAFIALDNLSKSMFNSTTTLRDFISGTDHPILEAYGESKGRFEYGSLGGHETYIYKWGRYGSGQNLSRVKTKEAIDPDESTCFFVNDVKTGGVSRLAEWMRDNRKFKRAFVLVKKKTPLYYKEQTKGGHTTSIPTVMTDVEVADELEKFAEDIGFPKIHVISQDTTAVRRVASTRLKSIFAYADYIRNDGARADSVVWDRVSEVDMEDGGLYFKLERGKSIKFGEKKIEWDPCVVKQHFSQMHDVINNYLVLEDEDQYDHKDLIGVGALDIKKFDKHDKWINIFDLFARAIPSYKAATIAVAKWNNTPDVIGLKSAIAHIQFLDHVNNLDEDSEFYKVVKQIQKVRTAMNAVNLIHTAFVSRFDRTYGKNEIEAVASVEYFKEDILIKYPMLTFVDKIDVGGYFPTNLNALFDYINLIDRS